MANGRNIKGITVEIGGDTTGLQKALAEVNSQIKDTQAQLKDVDKLLKLDPGNTELLQQKYRLLGEAVDETKQKLASLQEAARQANEQLARGEITQSQYDALQREIIETTQQLRELENQANQSAVALQKLAASGEKLKTIGDNISGIGEKLTPITAGVVALGTAAVKTAADFESGMSQVAAVSGASAEEMALLSEKAREMGASTKFSASEAAEAMNYMAMAGWKSEQMLGGIEGIMNLAAASGEDLGTTSDIVTDALTAFGLTADDSAHFADVLAAASSNANTNVSMMGETFKYAAAVAGSLGYSVEDTANAIGLMANAGIKSSQAGTALRTIMNKLQGDIALTGAALGTVTVQTVRADGTMKPLGQTLTELRAAFSHLSESEAASAAQSLVGTEAMSGFLALMNAAPEDVAKLADAIENADGTAKRMADTMNNNLTGQLTILKSQLQELAISVGEIIMPTVMQVVSALQKLMDWLNGFDDETKKTIVTIAAIVAAIGPVLIVIGKVISAIGTILTVLPKLGAAVGAAKTAFAGLSAVMAANPIGAVITLIGLLVAAFLTLWNNSEAFREYWKGLWEDICIFAQTAYDVWAEIFTDMGAKIREVCTNFVNFFTDFGAEVKTTATEISETVAADMADRITAVRDWFTESVTFTQEFFSNWGTNIVDLLTNVVNTAISFFTNLWDGVTRTMNGIVDTIVSGFNSAIDYIKSLPAQAKQWGADLINGIIDGIKSKINAVKDAVAGVADTIKSFLHFSVPDQGPLTDYQQWMPDFMRGLAESIEKSRGVIQGAMKDVSSDMVIGLNVPTVTETAKAPSVMQHTGTIRVEGVNDTGALSGVVDIIIDQLRQEVRT